MMWTGLKQRDYVVGDHLRGFETNKLKMRQKVRRLRLKLVVIEK